MGRFALCGVAKSLAFISAASYDGVVNDVDTLLSIPKIAEAQEKTEGRGSSLELVPPGTDAEKDAYRESLANRLLNEEHGSAMFENGKIKKDYGIEQFTGEVERGHHADIVIGRPAGCKSTVFANPLSEQHKAHIIDSDTVKQWLEGYDDGYGSGYVHNESAYIADIALAKAMSRGENVVIPRIGGDSTIKIAQKLRDNGYTVNLYFNDIPQDVSIMRAASRFAETGRYLALDYLQSIGDRPLNTFLDYAESGLFDYAEWRDNNIKHGEDPKLIWKTGDDNLASFRVDAESSGRYGQGNGVAGLLPEKGKR